MNVQDKDGEPAVMKAIHRRGDKCVEQLIEAGADVNIKNNNGDMAITWAVLRGRIKSVKLLIEAGAHVNISCLDDKNQSLPLLNKQKRMNILLLLFSAGQNLSAVPKKYLEEIFPETELSLKNICRKSIRNHLLQMSNVNLFVRVPRLGLPSILTDYLLYDQTLDGDDDNDDGHLMRSHLSRMILY